MEIGNLREILNSPAALYTTVGVGGIVVGYIGVIISSKRKKALKEKGLELELSREETRRAEIELEREKNAPEITRLNYEHAKAEYEGGLEKSARERQYALEDAERTQKQEAELRNEEEWRVAGERQYRLSLAKQLAELKPVLEKYLEAQPNGEYGPEIMKKRAEMKADMVEEYIEGFDNAELYNTDTYIDDVEIEKRIDRLVEMQHPLQESRQIPLPAELKKLINLIATD